jgi:hypothetical protein
VIALGAIDRRIKCVASQVPLISGHRNARRLIRADVVAGVEALCAEDRLKRYRGEKPGMILVVSSDPAGPAVLPTPDSWAWFDETGRSRAPAWRNEVTLRSVEPLLQRPADRLGDRVVADLARRPRARLVAETSSRRFANRRRHLPIVPGSDPSCAAICLFSRPSAAANTIYARRAKP